VHTVHVKRKNRLELFLNFSNVLNANLSKITEVDFSKNDLHDIDLPELVSFVEKSLPACHTVNLSRNKIFGFADADREKVDAEMFRLLSFSHVKAVIIYGNPIATRDRSDFILKLQTNQACAKKTYLDSKRVAQLWQLESAGSRPQCSEGYLFRSH